MKTLKMFGTASTASVLGYARTVEAACPRIAAPSVLGVEGTGLPVGKSMGDGPADGTRLRLAGIGAHFAVARDGDVVGTGVDRVEPTTVRIPAVANDQGDPPRRTPSRC